MKQIVSTRKIGSYTVSIDEDGMLQLETLTLEPAQTRELFQWLNEQRTIFTAQAAAPSPTTTPAASPEEVTRHAINEAIAQAQASYPASLAPESRDRFIEQIARHPTVRPLVSKGQVSRKQLMLWIDQQLSGK